MVHDHLLKEDMHNLGDWNIPGDKLLSLYGEVFKCWVRAMYWSNKLCPTLYVNSRREPTTDEDIASTNRISYALLMEIVEEEFR